MAKKNSFGFGFIPEEAQQHFLVILSPVNQNKNVLVYERFSWDEDREQQISGLPEAKMALNVVSDSEAGGSSEVSGPDCF